MGVEYEDGAVLRFDDWYDERVISSRDGALEYRSIAPCATSLHRRYEDYKLEMDTRCGEFYKLDRLADNEVISEKPDLPNVSSGETAGLIRRIARNLVQNTPNVEVISKFDDDSVEGIFAKHILTSNIVGTTQYSNDMQQNLFSSTKASLTLGFDCVIPVLQQRADGRWMVKYDTIHYRDVFPEPGVKDVRDATEVFVRRYLTKGEVISLIRNQTIGWDIAALLRLLRDNPNPPPRDRASVPHQTKKTGSIAQGYEIITWYSSSGRPFLTYSASTKMLLRIEKNKHPLKEHPVFFLVLEKDSQHPLGKSQVELLLGRQEFQDLMHNGAMKLWYRNINPSIIGYGTINSVPNLTPGKYTQISNPNARVEPFEVNTQTLMQYSSISQGNLGSMVNLVGSADQQMATQAGGGMSATPQGVEAQQSMVDITTNNYQKAIESFFSHYCSYALMMYFHELKGVKQVELDADARIQLLGAGLDQKLINKDGLLEVDFTKLATQYTVRCVPGSLVELEDEKQLRILNQLFIPLSQALPALASLQNPQVAMNTALTMQFILQRIIELSGSNKANDLKDLLATGQLSQQAGVPDEIDESLSVMGKTLDGIADLAVSTRTLQEQMRMMTETQGLLLQRLGMGDNASPIEQPNTEQPPQMEPRNNGKVFSAGAQVGARS